MPSCRALLQAATDSKTGASVLHACLLGTMGIARLQLVPVLVLSHSAKEDELISCQVEGTVPCHSKHTLHRIVDVKNNIQGELIVLQDANSMGGPDKAVVEEHHYFGTPTL